MKDVLELLEVVMFLNNTQLIFSGVNIIGGGTEMSILCSTCGSIGCITEDVSC